MNSYSEYVDKPEFYSTDYYFSVVLPNRSVAELSQQEFTKQQLSVEKTQLFDMDADVDWELNYFRDVVLADAREMFREKTINGLIALFERYRYAYNFNRRNLADILEVSENWTSQLIKKCIELGFMNKVKKDEYCFVAEKKTNDSEKL